MFFNFQYPVFLLPTLSIMLLFLRSNIFLSTVLSGSFIVSDISLLVILLLLAITLIILIWTLFKLLLSSIATFPLKSGIVSLNISLSSKIGSLPEYNREFSVILLTPLPSSSA